MSRQIDYTKRFSKEDERYLISRSREHEVITNRRKFGGDTDPASLLDVEANNETLDDFDEDIQAEVKKLNVEELRAELDEADPPVQYDKKTNKSGLQVLVARLYRDTTE